MSYGRKIVNKNKNVKNKMCILISSEGGTEDKYFCNFNERYSPFRVIIAKGNDGTDPVSIVKKAIKNLKQLDLDLYGRDKAFCVFDTDVDLNKNNQIISAIELANKYNIEVITSSPCFEIWYYLHFQFTMSFVYEDMLISYLNNKLPSYKKNSNIFKYICDYTNTAIENAKEIERVQLMRGYMTKTVQCNPHTEVYKIVELLLKSNV